MYKSEQVSVFVMSDLCDYGCGRKAEYEISSGKICCSKNYQSCPAVKKKNSQALKKAYEEGRKDTEHLDGYRSKNSSIPEKYVSKKKSIKETKQKEPIKRKLIERRKHKCEGCSKKSWRDEDIPLEIHRIDETKTYEESKPKNFKLLCPNCHAQTDNYRNKNGSPPGNKKATDEELAEAIKKKDSLRQALLSVGLAGRGGNYKRVKKIEKKIYQ